MSYEAQTEGIAIRVEPDFLLAQSQPAEGNYVFTYEVEMENRGDDTAQLLFRYWHIHDAAGEDEEVEGEGVVGQQPVIAPGGVHTYRSFCVLSSPAGWMEGYYTFVRPDGQRFRVRIPRFELQAPLLPRDESEGEPLLH